MSTLVTQQELDRRRQLRLARVKVADKHNVAIGWVNARGELLKADAPQLPKRPRDAA